MSFILVSPHNKKARVLPEGKTHAFVCVATHIRGSLSNNIENKKSFVKGSLNFFLLYIHLWAMPGILLQTANIHKIKLFCCFQALYRVF
jgi:hypothetical protein